MENDNGLIGLRRGFVYLQNHNILWEFKAKERIAKLQSVLGDVAIDIQHIGSTAIKNIHVKPIIDIIVGVRSIENMVSYVPILEKEQIYQRECRQKNQLLFIQGDLLEDIRTHHIHIVIWDSLDWKNYIYFRDYLNINRKYALEYDRIKLELAKKYECDRKSYTEGKNDIIKKILAEAYIYDKVRGCKIKCVS